MTLQEKQQTLIAAGFNTAGLAAPQIEEMYRDYIDLEEMRREDMQAEADYEQQDLNLMFNADFD